MKQTVLLSALALATISVAHPFETSPARFTFTKFPGPLGPSAPDEFTDDAVQLVRKEGGEAYSVQMYRKHCGHGGDRAKLQNYKQQQFHIPVKFGDEELHLNFDTGSSDTWAIAKGFSCSTKVPPSSPVIPKGCDFVPYNGTFKGKPIKHEYYEGVYGDGTSVAGDLGYQDLTFAGLKVKNQTV